jgi:hypothetical protein
VNVLSILINLLFTALYDTAAQFRCVIVDRFVTPSTSLKS